MLSGAFGHFMGELPWAHCDEIVRGDMAELVGMKLLFSFFLRK